MKITAKLLATAFALCLSAGSPALALDDTPATRAAQADLYLQAVPPRSLLNDMTEKMAATMPENQRASFKTLMNQNLDIDTLANVMRTAMIKNFSADELKALADFYGSPVGKSAMAKMGAYMADAMGPMMNELKRAVAVTQEQMKTK
jgi:hypothetical protein